MNTLRLLEIFGVSTAIFAAIDLVWLSFIASKLYRSQIGPLLRDKARPLPAVLFYVSYIIGIIYFAILPALDMGSLATAVINGALYGFFTYATFDLTNWSVLKNWPGFIVVVDIAWGIVLSGSVSTITYLILRGI